MSRVGCFDLHDIYWATLYARRTKTRASHDFDVFWCTLPIRPIFIGQILSTDRDASPQTKRESFRFYVCMAVKRRYLLVFSGSANVLRFLVFRPGVSRKRDVYRRIPFFRENTAFETTRRDGG